MMRTNIRITKLMTRLTALERERAEIIAEIETLQSAPSEHTAAIKVIPSEKAGDLVDRNSTIENKIALFRGRSDVFPIRWENRKTGRSGYAPACANEWQRGICEKPKVKCSACPNQAFFAVDDVSIERHLRGTDAKESPFIMGVYPMLADNTCSFLATDFDEGEWRRDVFAFRDTCQRHKIPVAIERSRSGNGAHAWIFFQEELFIQELVDHLVCGAAFEVCRQNRCMVGSLRSRRQNHQLSIREHHKILLQVVRHHRRHDRSPAGGASAGGEEA
jgi:hypothetical protein